jgi:hypothetical protein
LFIVRSPELTMKKMIVNRYRNDDH